MSKRRRASSSRVPIWGTFLILALLLVAGLSATAWIAYDHFLVKPKQAQDRKEMQELWKAWDLAMQQASHARARYGAASEDAERDILTIGIRPESPWENEPGFAELKRNQKAVNERWVKEKSDTARGEDAYWKAKLEECVKKADELNRRSQERFGVPAEELARLLGQQAE
jgi:hypothetical protein